MTRAIGWSVAVAPLWLWGVCGVILIPWLHALPAWVWILALAPSAALTGILATWLRLETPEETRLRQWARQHPPSSLARTAPSRRSSAPHGPLGNGRLRSGSRGASRGPTGRDG